MRFSKTSQKVLSIAMAAVVVAGVVTVSVPKKADAAKKYKAGLYMQTDNFYNRDTFTNTNTCKGIKLKTGAQIAGTKATDTTFKKGKFKFTVTLTGFKKVKKAKSFNCLGVCTTLPGVNKKKLSGVKLVVKVDGKTVKTIKNPAMEPEKGTSGNVNFLAVNTYNTQAKKKCKSIKMPKKSVSITVSGKLK